MFRLFSRGNQLPTVDFVNKNCIQNASLTSYTATSVLNVATYTMFNSDFKHVSLRVSFGVCLVMHARVVQRKSARAYECRAASGGAGQTRRRVTAAYGVTLLPTRFSKKAKKCRPERSERAFVFLGLAGRV